MCTARGAAHILSTWFACCGFSFPPEWLCVEVALVNGRVTLWPWAGTGEKTKKMPNAATCPVKEKNWIQTQPNKALKLQELCVLYDRLAFGSNMFAVDQVGCCPQVVWSETSCSWAITVTSAGWGAHIANWKSGGTTKVVSLVRFSLSRATQAYGLSRLELQHLHRAGHEVFCQQGSLLHSEHLSWDSSSKNYIVSLLSCRASDIGWSEPASVPAGKASFSDECRASHHQWE